MLKSISCTTAYKAFKLKKQTKKGGVGNEDVLSRLSVSWFSRMIRPERLSPRVKARVQVVVRHVCSHVPVRVSASGQSQPICGLTDKLTQLTSKLGQLNNT